MILKWLRFTEPLLSARRSAFIRASVKTRHKPRIDLATAFVLEVTELEDQNQRTVSKALQLVSEGTGMQPSQPGARIHCAVPSPPRSPSDRLGGVHSEHHLTGSVSGSVDNSMRATSSSSLRQKPREFFILVVTREPNSKNPLKR